MINIEFTKRLVGRLNHGAGGWAPAYMFYMGQNAQVVLTSVPLTESMLLADSAALRAAYAKHGTNEVGEFNPSIDKQTSLLNFNRRSGRDTANSDPFKDRLSNTDGGFTHTAVVQNYYNNVSTSPDTTDDGLNSGVNRLPYIISELDPSVPVDPVGGAFNYSLDFQLSVDPEVRLASGLGTSKLVDFLNIRMRSNNTNTSEDPYLFPRINCWDSNFYFNQTTIPKRLKLGWSYLDVTDPTNCIRFLGYSHTTASGSPFSRIEFNPQLLKMRIFTSDANTDSYVNPNCTFLTVEGSDTYKWYNVNFAYISANRMPTPGISAVKSAPWLRGSCNVLGYTNDNSGNITAMAGVRAPRRIYNVIAFDRGGPTGSATYFVERYQRQLIEKTLSAHLPTKNPDGSVVDYFTKGVFTWGAYYSGYGSYKNQGPSWMLQPVAFPMAQQPEDPWLYYVSMDESYRYYLNRQELGKAHVSEPLLELTTPMIQMQVHAGKVWMLYRNRIDIYDPATSNTTKYLAGTSNIPNDMSSIAVDREHGQIYIGHSQGIFNFTTLSAVAVNLSSITQMQRRVADTKLVAVNNYLAWVTTQHNYVGSETQTFTVRHNLTSGNTHAYSYSVLTGVQDHCSGTNPIYSDLRTRELHNVVYAVSLRSNGDLVFLHSRTGNINLHLSPSLTWCSVDDSTGYVHRYHTMQAAFEWEEQSPSETHGSSDYNPYQFDYVTALYRVDDFHYTAFRVKYEIASGTKSRKDGSSLQEVFLGSSFSNPDDSWGQANDYRLNECDYHIVTHPVVWKHCSTSKVPSVLSSYLANDAEFGSIKDIPVPYNSCRVRATDFEHATRSHCVVILDKCYSLFVCGMQYGSNLGIELDWDGTDWVHGVAGTPKRSKRTHTNQQPVSPWLNIGFTSGAVFNGQTVYRVDTYPGTSSPVQDVFMYLGDLVPATRSFTVNSTVTELPKDFEGQNYCGIEYERPDLLKCVVSGTELTYTTGTPTSNQFAMHKNTLTLHSSRVGSSCILDYHYVKAAE